MKTLVRRLRRDERMCSPIAPAEVLGHRIQQSLQVILAGLDERDALSGADMEALQRELRMLLQIERIQIATGGDRQGRAGPGSTCCARVSKSA